MYKKLLSYYGKHPIYCAVVNFIIGLGLGIIISRPLGVHPLRFGLIILAAGVLGKLYPIIVDKVK